MVQNYFSKYVNILYLDLHMLQGQMHNLASTYCNEPTCPC